MIIPSRVRFFFLSSNQNQSETPCENNEENEIKTNCINYKVPEDIDEETNSINELYEVKPEIFNGSENYDINESKKYPVIFSIDTENNIFISETRTLDVMSNHFKKDRKNLNYFVIEITNLSNSTLIVYEIIDVNNLDEYHKFEVKPSKKIILEYSKDLLNYNSGKYKNLKIIIKGRNFKYRFLLCYDL